MIGWIFCEGQGFERAPVGRLLQVGVSIEQRWLQKEEARGLACHGTHAGVLDLKLDVEVLQLKGEGEQVVLLGDPATDRSLGGDVNLAVMRRRVLRVWVEEGQEALLALGELGGHIPHLQHAQCTASSERSLQGAMGARALCEARRHTFMRGNHSGTQVSSSPSPPSSIACSASSSGQRQRV